MTQDAVSNISAHTCNWVFDHMEEGETRGVFWGYSVFRCLICGCKL